MAENGGGGGGMSQEDKKFLVDTGIKVGLVIWAASILKRTFTFTDPGRTDRLMFDLERTQNRYMPIGDGQYEIIPDPWTPADIARRAHSIFNGVTFTNEDHINIYNEISTLGVDRARWLHNYWLDEIDDDDTIYRWIDKEYVRINPGIFIPGYDEEELEAKQTVMKFLKRWGAGF